MVLAAKEHNLENSMIGCIVQSFPQTSQTKSSALTYIPYFYAMTKWPIIFLLFTSVAAYGKGEDATANCKQFRTGKFYLDDSASGRTIIERNDSVQVEINESLGAKLRLRITWINDCTYTLSLIGMEGPKDDSDDWPPGLVLTSVISNSDGNSYTQTTSANLFKMTFTNKVVRIK